MRGNGADGGRRRVIEHHAGGVDACEAEVDVELFQRQVQRIRAKRKVAGEREVRRIVRRVERIVRDVCGDATAEIQLRASAAETDRAAQSVGGGISDVGERERRRGDGEGLRRRSRRLRLS